MLATICLFCTYVLSGYRPGEAEIVRSDNTMKTYLRYALSVNKNAPANVQVVSQDLYEKCRLFRSQGGVSGW